MSPTCSTPAGHPTSAGASQSNPPPGWTGAAVPRNLMELARSLEFKLQQLRRSLRNRTTEYRGPGIVIRQERATPEHVKSLHHYAVTTSRNAIRWLDDRQYFVGRPPGVTSGDTLPDAEDKLSRLLQWVRETGETAAGERERANSSKLFPFGPPDNPDIRDLVVRLNSFRDAGQSQRALAREFTGETPEDDRKAQSLLAQIRRLRRAGRVNL